MQTFEYLRLRKSKRAEAEIVDDIWRQVDDGSNNESGRIEFTWIRRGPIWLVVVTRYQPLDFTAKVSAYAMDR